MSSIKEALTIRAQAFVDRKYVLRADARQKEMGLAYVEAERQDLAREIARFCTNEVEAALATFQPDSERREAIARIIDPVAFDSCTPRMYGLKNQKELETLTMVGPARRIARDKADRIIASGLVQENKK